MAIGRHKTHFAGRKIIETTGGILPDDVSGVAIRIAAGSTRKVKRADALGRPLEFTYEKDEFTDVLARLLSQPQASRIEALVIGRWSDEMFEDASAEVASSLIQAAGTLTSLQALFVGDVTYEESEISWIIQSDLGALVRAYPRLEVFGARGGTRLRLSDLRHDTLEELILETGGLSAACVRDVASAHLPALRTLELWLGTDEYGGDSTVEDLQPILSGKLFPHLRALRLRNCQYADALARAVALAPVLEGLQALDLSMGTLCDRGAEAFLTSPGAAKLYELNLSDNVLSPELPARLREALPEVHSILTENDKFDDWDPAEEEEDEDGEPGYMSRYVTHSE